VATTHRCFCTTATTLALPFFRITSLRVCACTAHLLVVLGKRLCSLGGHLQVLSPTTRLYSRHYFTHVFNDGIASIPFLLLFPFFNFLYLADAGSTHLNFNKEKPHQCTKCYPQPCGDYSSMLLYLSDDAGPAPLPSHLAPGLRRYSAIARRFTRGVFVFFRRPPSSFVTNNETLQQASSHSCFSGRDSGHPLPLSLPPPYLSCSCSTPYVSLV
jgi:hypothetical protein